jgi:nucleotide-binding universal stress UspA family protein
MVLSLGKILVPTDFSDTAETALQYGTELARRLGAELHVLHVSSEGSATAAWPVLGAGVDIGREAAELRERLQKLASADGGEPLHTEVHVIVGQPALAIAGYALDHELDLIVMGTHGRGPVTHALLGSVAEKVVRTAPCPVLTIRHPSRRQTAVDQLRASLASTAV